MLGDAPGGLLRGRGFTELLPLNFNDVDLCYKTRKEGYRIVWVANCEAYHFESRTRVNTVESWEKASPSAAGAGLATIATCPGRRPVRKYKRQGKGASKPRSTSR